MRRAVRFGFPAWARASICDPPRPSAVRRHFAAYGLVLTREQWRRILKGEIREVPVETWCRICDITGQPLSFFFEYVPPAERPEPRPLPKSLRPPRRPAPPPRRRRAWQAPPPNPSKFYSDEQTA